jgi:hypothetical protein
MEDLIFQTHLIHVRILLGAAASHTVLCQRGSVLADVDGMEVNQSTDSVAVGAMMSPKWFVATVDIAMGERSESILETPDANTF